MSAAARSDPPARSRLLAHPGLTMNVYRVDRETLRRTPVSSVSVGPDDAPPTSLAYPPCRCLRCTHSESVVSR